MAVSEVQQPRLVDGVDAVGGCRFLDYREHGLNFSRVKSLGMRDLEGGVNHGPTVVIDRLDLRVRPAVTRVQRRWERLASMRDEGYSSEQIAAYGATAQPAIAARMTPHLRMTFIGTACAALGVGTSLAAVLTFPKFSDREVGAAWAVVALITAVLVFAICVLQVVVWRRAMASWRGIRIQDLRGEARLSWIIHLVSYAVVLVGMWACIAGAADAGWSATAGVLLAATMLLIIAGQVLAGVQYLRPSGPPGTVPAHMRRLVRRADRREGRRTSSNQR